MGILKSIERIKRMHDLISREFTGTAKEFADKVGISRSMLMENIREMRTLGAEIDYCAHRRSYYYTQKFDLIIGSQSKKRIMGGINIILTDFSISPMALDRQRIN